MDFGYLGKYFEGVAVKSLSMVDATPSGSNQHEIGTTVDMRRKFLGESKIVFAVTYIFFDESAEPITEAGTATHYDSRENNPARAPEWRLYYQGNLVTETMQAGDTLFLAKSKDVNRLFFIVCRPDSTVERQLDWLFGAKWGGSRFTAVAYAPDEVGLNFAGQLILDELGITSDTESKEYLDELIEHFGNTFPKTSVLSDYARRTCREVDPLQEPDLAVETWLAHEEALFKRLEHKVIRKRLEEGFYDGSETDTDGFLRFSLSVQNRRKSRMGHAFEHHLAALFDAFNLRYARQVITENRQKPDFLFPSLEAYRNATTPDGLCMLAVKSSCKDRWRQILSEAEKIPEKHLATLEAGISEAQTSQMVGYGVQLVVPASILSTYLPSQQGAIWSVSDFISFASVRFS